VVKRILVTGMSGTGKSSALRQLSTRGHRTVDTDTDEWSRWVSLPDGSADWVWREPPIRELLSQPLSASLFVSGCKSNQGQFYPSFDEVVLLSAPADVLLARIAGRRDNPYGQSPEERATILSDLATVEPLLRRTATAEIDATLPLGAVVDALEQLARPGTTSGETGS
jgi:shikimate kinase